VNKLYPSVLFTGWTWVGSTWLVPLSFLPPLVQEENLWG